MKYNIFFIANTSKYQLFEIIIIILKLKNKMIREDTNLVQRRKKKSSQEETEMS